MRRSVGVTSVAALAVLVAAAMVVPRLFTHAGTDGAPAHAGSAADESNPGGRATVSDGRATSDARVVPEGMVYVPGGTTRIGSETGLPEEGPPFTTRVAPFFMDVHPVTVAQFRAFARDQGYVTEAERFGSAGVFDLERREWLMVAGATWERPRGPDAPVAPDDHPVTQVSWNDAAAFARWAGKRLPSEVEWEHAARGGRDSRAPYAWGSSLVAGGVHRANTWQGSFPARNTGEDGHVFTSPVGAFGTTALGLADMGGNVWEWTADWFRPYAERGTAFTPRATSERVQRGGSFLCHESYCHGYRVSARSHSTPETSLFHVGFRLVRDAGERGGERAAPVGR